MTKQEFKTRWELNEFADNMSYRDIENCAVAWGITENPRGTSMLTLRYLVVKAASVTDAESYNPVVLQEEWGKL